MTLDLIKKGKDLVHPRALVMRFPPFLETENIVKDMKMIMESAKGWIGEPIPAFFFCHVTSNSSGCVNSLGTDIVRHPGGWPVGFLPLDRGGIHQGVLDMKWASSLRIERNFDSTPYPPEPVVTRPFIKALEPSPPIRPENVPPQWRFLLTEEAKKDGEEFHKEMTFYGPHMSIPSPGEWMRKHVIAKLDKRWPNVGRADKLSGGLISQALEAVAADPNFPKWWLSLPIMLRKGCGESATKCCDGIIARDPSQMLGKPRSLTAHTVLLQFDT